MSQQEKRKTKFAGLLEITTKSKVFLHTLCAFSILVKFSKIRFFKPRCEPASPSAFTRCSTARIRQDISAASFSAVNCSDELMSLLYSLFLTHRLIFLQLRTAVSQRWVYVFPPIAERGALIVYVQCIDT